MSTPRNPITITFAPSGSHNTQINHIALGMDGESMEAIISRLLAEMDAQRETYERIICKLIERI